MTSTLFTRMATAAIDELEPQERTKVDPKVFTRILSICAAVAESELESTNPTVPIDPSPKPPATQFITACLLVPGDFVWNPRDLVYSQIDVVKLHDGKITAVYGDATTETFAPDGPVQVAVSNRKADKWNEDRLFMDQATLRSLHATYGS